VGHDALWARLLQVGAALGVSLVVYYAGCRLLRVRELDHALAAFLPKQLGWR
jgi:hypothetical protein